MVMKYQKYIITDTKMMDIYPNSEITSFFLNYNLCIIYIKEDIITNLVGTFSYELDDIVIRDGFFAETAVIYD